MKNSTLTCPSDRSQTSIKNLFDELEDIDYTTVISNPVIKKGVYTQNIIFDTQVEVENPIFDYKPIEIVSVELYPKLLNSDKVTPSIFKELFKKSTYALLELNPNITKKMLHDLLGYFNNKCPNNKMEREDLINIIDSCWETFNSGSWYEVSRKMKKFHWNSNFELSNKEKRSIRQTIVNANHFNNEMEKMKSIRDANPGIKQNELMELYKISKTRLRMYWNYNPKDIDLLVLELNSK